MNSTALLDTNGIIFMGIYLASLIFVGLAGRFYRKDDSMSDFYLGGRSMGLFVLFLTLYATQYSGNTMIGFAGKSYRQGYCFIVSVTFMISVIAAYLIYAPKLYELSRKYKFITIGDYIQNRFGSRLLTIIVTSICIIALGNYILSNLKAIGYIVVTSTGGRVSFTHGIIIVSVIMIIYETLGGMRSVAWTDVIQGILLLVGCLFIFGIIQYQYGGLAASAKEMITSYPQLWEPPDAEQKRFWLSSIIIFFFGISIYPQAIQRIYAAKDSRTLKRSFQIMAFMPLVTTFFMFIVGVIGITKFQGLDKQRSEQIALLLLNDIAQHIPGVKIFIVLFISAAVAAIMSTVDSALLAISSLFTQDIYRPIRPSVSQKHLTSTGKIFSWIIMGFMAYLAMILPQTIWKLIEIKLEILCQVSPAIFLGVHIKTLRCNAILYGIIIGVCVTLFLLGANMMGLPIPSKPWGIHAGVYGLAVNFLTIGLVSLRNRQTKNSDQLAMNN
ncbi:MAG: sodium:solute symporter family protein [Candidatus Anammoxibacter sp.]